MSFRRHLFIVTTTVGAALLLARPAAATPSLQLDLITNGGAFVSYDSSSETIITSQTSFTVRALLVEKDGNLLTDRYFLSVALVPKTERPGDYGSFKFDDTPINVTAGMEYGTPPLNMLFPNVGDHGIFETYYLEHAFTFPTSDPNVQTFQETNVQETHWGGDYLRATSGKIMYAADFRVDASSLQPGFGLHFDLYNETIKVKNNKTTYDTLSAPFSHDAEYRSVPTPEPTSLAIWGLCGVGLLVRRRRSQF